MFGYVIPYFPELKLKDFERFRACYCGLCHTLKRKYGFAARFILNYDFVFLAMLLRSGEEKTDFSLCRCAAHPIRRRCVCGENTALDISAAECVILTYWKLRDDGADEKGLGAVKSAAARSVLKRAYDKAKAELPEYDAAVGKSIDALASLEKEKTASLDEAADKFAALLSLSAQTEQDESRRRILAHVLYHTGRFVYIADAADDYDDDMKRGRYNPLVHRFETENRALSPEDREKIRVTLFDSVNVIATDLALAERTEWTPILENIIEFGMPDTAERVSNGTFRQMSRRKMEKELNSFRSDR